MSSAETRQLSMHPNLLMQVIKRQAGTVEKAILEGVMNAVDAKAGKVEVVVTNNRLVITDDGEGMTSRAHIEKVWEMFGQPADPSEQKTYGFFRMGRGQLFAFGRNVWRTSQFQMSVDIEKDGLKYELRENLPEVSGCRIEIDLYRSLLPSDLATVKRALSDAVKYAPCEIIYNGATITKQRVPEEWEETDEAWIRLRTTGSLSIYNLGVLVCTFPGHRFGCGGEVVSRKQLRVNFARNEIMSDCPVWRVLKPKLDQRASKRISRSGTLTDDARQRLIDQLLAGELSMSEAMNAKVITDAAGRSWSYASIQAYNYKHRITVAMDKDQRAKSVMAHRLAFVLAASTLERFKLPPTGVSQLIEIMDSATGRHSSWSSVAFETLVPEANAFWEIIEPDQYTDVECVALDVLTTGYFKMLGAIDEGSYANRRKIVVGHSEVQEAWTDGETYIAISRESLRQISYSIGDWSRYGMLLLEASMWERNNHAAEPEAPEFYATLWLLAAAGLPAFIDGCVAQVPRAVERYNRELTRKQLAAMDKQCLNQKAAETLKSQSPAS